MKVLGCVLSLVFVMSCSQPGSLKDEPLLLFAAASTTNAIEEIVTLFQDKYGTVVRCNYASSSTLAKQIDAGAQADVYISANMKWADYIEDKNLVVERITLLGNSIVFIVPAESSIIINSPMDLLNSSLERLTLADPSSVPAGIYGKEALVKLNLWEKLQPKVVRAADVRKALVFVERGEVDGGIVYSTDAAITDKVKIVYRFDETLTQPIEYALVLVKTQHDNPNAKKLFAFLQSPPAEAIFTKYGFDTVQ